MHGQVGLAADGQLAICAVAVGEAGQRKGHWAVCGVLKGHDAIRGVAIANSLKDVLMVSESLDETRLVYGCEKEKYP